MKLPRSRTRRYRVLRAFVGKRMTLDELVSAFGLFEFKWRSSLLTELTLLRKLGYLRFHGGRYLLAGAVEQAFIEAGEPVCGLVEPRRYNVFDRPPLQKRRLHDPSMRRPNCLEVTVSRHFTASDPIDFQDEE